MGTFPCPPGPRFDVIGSPSCSAEPRAFCGDLRSFADARLRRKSAGPRQIGAWPCITVKTHRDLSHASYIMTAGIFARAPYHRIEEPDSARLSSPRRPGSDALGWCWTA